MSEADNSGAKHSIVASFLSRLSQPFPEQEDVRRALIQSALTAVFVALFLYFVQPFVAPGDTLDTFLHCLGYGVVTFVVNVGFDWFRRRVLKIRTDVATWTLGKWIISVVCLISCIALGNFLYFNASVDWQYFNGRMLSIMLFNTFVVGIFPTVAWGSLIQFRARHANEKNADEILTPTRDEDVIPTARQLSFGAQMSDSFSLEAGSVRYIEAMQNYISVCYVSEGKIYRNLVRETLSNAEAECRDSDIIRCHRSFLVNVAQIDTVTGNAQGLKLGLHDVNDDTVPVSRSYIGDLKNSLANR